MAIPHNAYKARFQIGKSFRVTLSNHERTGSREFGMSGVESESTDGRICQRFVNDGIDKLGITSNRMQAIESINDSCIYYTQSAKTQI